MIPTLVCASHSPLMYCAAREPERHGDIERAFSERAEAVRRFAPDVVFVFGPDHYNGFFMKLMPPFCVGTAGRSVPDIGGFEGVFDVPAEMALGCVRHVREAGVDVAVSYDMTMDHGFSQPMHRVLGAMDTFPVVPIFINAVANPYVPFRRSRLLGEAVGTFTKSLGDARVLFLASGGMSHNPLRYYPTFGTGEERVTEYQLRGGVGGDGLTREEWFERLETMHREGAHMLVDGRRTKADIKLNAVADQEFLDLLVSGNLEAMDDWVPERKVEEAGIGFLELHTWLAAAAANKAAGGSTPMVDIYAETLEYGIALGVVHAGGV